MSNSTLDKKNLLIFFFMAFIGACLGNVILSKTFSYRTTEGVKCENSVMDLTVTCPPSKPKTEPLPEDDTQVTLNLASDNDVNSSPLNGLPGFLIGVSPDYVLNAEEVQQILNNKAYQKYKDDPRLKPIVINAKKDSILTYAEYEKIENKLLDIYYSDKQLKDTENSKKFVDQL